MRAQDFTTGGLPRHIVRMALPIFLGMVFQTLYYLVDLYFVSRLGPAAVAGVSAAGNVQFLVMAFTQVLSVGTMGPIAQALGRRDPDDASRLFHQALTLSLGCVLLVLGVGYAAAGPFGTRIGADAETARAATTYLAAILPGFALQFPMQVCASALRAAGINTPIMLVQVASVVGNAILAPILIAGVVTGRPLGVAGAGLATTLAVVGATVAMLAFTRRLSSVVGLDRRKLRPEPAVWRRIAAVGLPAGGEMGLMFLFTGLIYVIIRDVGAAAQAGFGIGSRVMQSMFIPAMAIAFAAAPVAGQNIGAGQAGRARETFLVGVGLETLCMVLLTALAHWQGPTMVGWFTHDPAVSAVAVEFLLYISWNFAAQGVIFTASGMFQALGDTVPSLMASATRVVTFAGPGLWLSRQPGFTLSRLWLLSIATVTLQAGVSVWLLFRTWKRRTAAAVVVPAAA